MLQDGHTIAQQWRSLIERGAFTHSAENLAHYLVLRRHDLRAIQATLMPMVAPASPSWRNSTSRWLKRTQSTKSLTKAWARSPILSLQKSS